MKKLRSFLSVLLCAVLVLSAVSAVSAAGTDFSAVSFRVRDLISDKTATFVACSGVPSVLVFGGVGSCGNTVALLEALPDALGLVTSAAPEVFVIDVKENTDAFILDAVRSLGLPENVVVASEGSLVGTNPHWSLLNAIEGPDTYGYTMPLVAFLDGSGVLRDGYTAVGTQKRLIEGLSSICKVATEKLWVDLPFEVTCLQSEARRALASVNELRTGSRAWYWNETDTAKVYCKDLAPLTYDYALERVALQRAMELVVMYSHGRPSGESCFAAYEEAGYVFYAAGENIAYGQRTIVEVETDWEEENEYYVGQGHRRNMLDADFRAFGCAGVEYKGVRFWVQEFGDIVNEPDPTPANDSLTAATVRAQPSAVLGWRANVKSVRAEAGEKLDLSKNVTAVAELASGRSLETTLRPTWSVADETIATVKGEMLNALKAGETTLLATVGTFEPFEVRLVVTGSAVVDPDPDDPDPDDPVDPDLPVGSVPGDADGDGKVTASDARLALRRSVDLESYAPGTPAFIACDVDKSGTVTAADARLILRAAVGLEKL